jgi:hypothetical protein
LACRELISIRISAAASATKWLLSDAGEASSIYGRAAGIMASDGWMRRLGTQRCKVEKIKLESERKLL